MNPGVCLLRLSYGSHAFVALFHKLTSPLEDEYTSS